MKHVGVQGKTVPGRGTASCKALERKHTWLVQEKSEGKRRGRSER